MFILGNVASEVWRFFLEGIINSKPLENLTNSQNKILRCYIELLLNVIPWDGGSGLSPTVRVFLIKWIEQLNKL